MESADRPGSAGAPPCDVSIVIPNWNGGSVLSECVDSILEHTRGTDFELILVDNGSTDQSRAAVAAYAEKHPRVTAILNDENLFFARACNQGFAASRGRYVLIANNDIVLTDDAVSRLVDYADRHPGTTVVTPCFVGPNGEPQELVRRLPNAAFILAYYHRLGRAFDRILLGRRLRDRYLYRDTIFDEPRPVEQPGASFSLIRRTAVEQLGMLFNESFPLLFNDVDLARRLRDAGAISVVLPDVTLIHLGGISSEQLAPELYRKLQFDAIFRYFRKHHPLQYVLLCFAWPSKWTSAKRTSPPSSRL